MGYELEAVLGSVSQDRAKGQTGLDTVTARPQPAPWRALNLGGPSEFR